VAYGLTHDAEVDLDEIWWHVAGESGVPEIAQHLIETITERFDTLSTHPRMGRARNDLRRGLRGHPVGNYLIFYRIVGTNVLILRILHGRRDLRALLDRR
jgi:toxin ParE1/3/4